LTDHRSQPTDHIHTHLQRPQSLLCFVSGGEQTLKVEINIDPACTEPKIVIHTDRMTDEIQTLVRQLSSPEPDVIPAQSGGGIALLPPEKILRVYTERQKVCAQTADGVYPLKFRLYEMEEKLRGHSFVRISSSELVNTKMISGMDFSSCTMVLPISPLPNTAIVICCSISCSFLLVTLFII
jgi:hypothetical protein